ncbi:MAG TPA: hypothetical protein VLW50_26915 [Streptosporangiaceae bacterium]|nr:hypothetical protein [Streptosporangiaceae bacterium]
MISCALPGDRRTGLWHDRIGDDQAAGEAEVGAHPRRVEPQPACERALTMAVSRSP